MANQVRCYVFIESNNVPVRGAIVSAQRCSDNCIRLARTDIFGTAVLNLPNGTYLLRCECVPNFLEPSTAEYCVQLNPLYCSADLLFPCRLVSANVQPLNLGSNVSAPNQIQNIARSFGINPSNTLSNSFMGINQNLFPNEAPQVTQNGRSASTSPSGAQVGPNISRSQLTQDPAQSLQQLPSETLKYSLPQNSAVAQNQSSPPGQASIRSIPQPQKTSGNITRSSPDRTGVSNARQSNPQQDSGFTPKDFT